MSFIGESYRVTHLILALSHWTPYMRGAGFVGKLLLVLVQSYDNLVLGYWFTVHEREDLFSRDESVMPPIIESRREEDPSRTTS